MSVTIREARLELAKVSAEMQARANGGAPVTSGAVSAMMEPAVVEAPSRSQSKAGWFTGVSALIAGVILGKSALD